MLTTPLLELLRCPFCQSALARGRRRRSRCTGCGGTFGVEDGIPLMLHEELPGAREKLARDRGLGREGASAEGWYEPDDEVDSVLPFVNRELGWDDSNWLANGHSFQVLLDRYIEDPRGLRVLEVGAAKAWAARFWLERDCEYVATDILVDPKIGARPRRVLRRLRRACRPTASICRSRDATFDVTYCVATLHHALDLRQMVREMARVTRPGGVVAGLNEGTAASRAARENPEQAAEKELGINEHVHTVWAYVGAFARAGLVVRRVERRRRLAAAAPYG